MSNFIPANTYPENVESFLNKRNITFEELVEFANKQFKEIKMVLITSSAVHGIATPTSDVDLIAISAEALPSDQMARQAFIKGLHCEVVGFSEKDVSDALKDLHAISVLDTDRLLSRIDAWNSSGRIKLKYLERLINGVASNLTLPYLNENAVALKRIWIARSYDLFQQLHICAILAVRAGESFAGRGYVINAALYAMDCILSDFGRLYSNKKWYLLRWEMEKTRLLDIDKYRPCIELIDRLWASAKFQIDEPTPYTLIEQLIATYNSVSDCLNFPRKINVQNSVQENASAPFIKDARFLSACERSVVLHEKPYNLTSDPDCLLTLKKNEAKAILQSIRAGAIHISLKSIA